LKRRGVARKAGINIFFIFLTFGEWSVRRNEDRDKRVSRFWVKADLESFCLGVWPV
jgi:hypothetical protein